MFDQNGYCSSCVAWFSIPESTLAAHRLCPSCLTPTAKVRRAPLGVLRLFSALRPEVVRRSDGTAHTASPVLPEKGINP